MNTLPRTTVSEIAATKGVPSYQKILLENVNDGGDYSLSSKKPKKTITADKYPGYVSQGKDAEVEALKKEKADWEEKFNKLQAQMNEIAARSGMTNLGISSGPSGSAKQNVNENSSNSIPGELNQGSAESEIGADQSETTKRGPGRPRATV